ncbi:hypothetical protein AYO21_10608 [Fonsecaea monophora]|uniref:non-specific serine/threonine protein kinase n=1 Tax=Fonsecaea monophora TaxID=254056 RepID=A0A177EVA3_9EURO|nr:hypothetical protein AYO21_10608 [Fonsecaea monophora]OAG35210.1 hypothetical protein AYO21_10608 [Fonsecaea monophora]
MARRFERIYDAVEPVKQNRHGGCHPVHLGDISSSRYKTVAKIGYGQYSTVWLALDQRHKSSSHLGANFLKRKMRRNRSQRYVALKVVKAEQSKTNDELEYC